jgi:hypothetical protein
LDSDGFYDGTQSTRPRKILIRSAYRQTFHGDDALGLPSCIDKLGIPGCLKETFPEHLYRLRSGLFSF